jgi:hypothetical protein
LDERLDHLEESIRDLDKSMIEQKQKQQQRPIPPPPIPPRVVPEVEVVQEKTTLKSSDQQEPSKANNQCAWRNSSPINTTFEV